MPGMWDAGNGGFVTFVKAQATLTAQIGVGANCRFWPGMPPQKVPTLPYGIFARSGGQRYPYHGGISARRTALSVWTYGATAAAASALMELFIAVLTNFRGTWSGVVVMRCEVLDAPEDGYDNPADNSEDKRFWCRLPIAVIHNES